MKRVVWYFNESLVLLFCTIQGETQSELALTKQSVLIVVDNITSVFAEKLQQPETFLEIVPAVIAYVKLHKTCPFYIEIHRCLSHSSPAVQASALLCIATMLSELNTHCITYLTAVMTTMLALWERILVSKQRRVYFEDGCVVL